MAYKRKTRPAAPPTIEQRINAAAAKREAALSVFRDAHDDLRAAADEADEAVLFVESEMARLHALRDAAVAERTDADAKAMHLGNLLGL